jgi:hypothetical protein
MRHCCRVLAVIEGPASFDKDENGQSSVAVTETRFHVKFDVVWAGDESGRRSTRVGRGRRRRRQQGKALNTAWVLRPSLLIVRRMRLILGFLPGA